MSDVSGAHRSVLWAAAVITQVHLWIYLSLLVAWHYRNKKTTEAQSKLQMVTAASLVCFTVVFILEAIYTAGLLAATYIDMKNWGHVMVCLMWTTKLGPQLIISHFVLELIPVYIVLRNDIYIK